MLASEFTKTYLQLFFRQQRLQWEIYAEGAGHDLNIVDSDIYRLLQTDVSVDGYTERELAVYHAIVSRGLVDKHPDVARLRNRLDNWDNYLTGLEHISDRYEQRLYMAVRMRPDVIKLMRLRDQLARIMGFPAYVDLVLSSEDLERNSVRKEITAYLKSHLPRARDLAASHHLTWNTWFSDIRAISGDRKCASSGQLTKQLLNRLGLSGAAAKLTLVCKQQRIGGYAGVLEPGRDVRVLLGTPDSLEGVRTLCHELGHALAHLYSETNGLLQTWTASYDEAMAVLLEQIGIRQLLSGEELQTAMEISLLENVRCSISFMFELDLWEEPERAESLFCHHYGQLGIASPDPVVWASDSFRSIDPVYIHNYVLGAAVADQIINRLPGSPKETGPWLVERLYRDGRRRPLYQKLADILT